MSTIIFDSEIAKQVGVNAAIIFEKIRYFCEDARLNKTKYKFHQGYYWTYSSRKAWSEQFQFLSDAQIKKAINILRDKGFIITGNFNHNRYDRTLWYAVVKQKDESPIVFIEPMHEVENTQSIDLEEPINWDQETNQKGPHNPPIPNESTNKTTNESVVVEQKNPTTPSSTFLEFKRYIESVPYYRRLKAQGAMKKVWAYYGSLEAFKLNYERLYSDYCKRKQFPNDQGPKDEAWYTDCYESIENKVLKEANKS